MPLTDQQVDKLIQIFDALNAVGVNDFKIQKAVRNITHRSWMTLDENDLSVLRQEEFEALARRLEKRLRELQGESRANSCSPSTSSHGSKARAFFAFTEAAQFQTEAAFNMDEWESGIDFEES